MDANQILLWTALLWAGVGLAQLARIRAWHLRGWLSVNIAIGLVAGVGWVAFPSLAGWISGGMALLLVLAPALVLRWANREMQALRYRRAALLARVAGLLHPFDGWRARPFLIDALDLAQRGERDRARALLAPRAAERTAAGRQAALQLARLDGRWEDAVDFGARALAAGELEREPDLASIYGRALAETGRVEELLRLSRRLAPLLDRLALAALLDSFFLHVFAFTGRREQLEALFRSRLARVPEPIRRFWLATADLTGGRDEAAQAELAALMGAPDRQLAAAAERRLAAPPRPPHLDEAARAGVEALATRLAEERRFGVAARPSPAWATLSVLAANLAVFAAEVALGGSTDEATLFRLGALEPAAVAAGGFWRVAAATFLHFGPLHLGLNMVALLVLGRWLEQALGAARWLAVWLAASIGGNLLNLALVHFGVIPSQVLVGASGGVMGLIGGTGALLVRGWAGEGSRLARRRLGAIAAIVLLQVAFDLVTPNVSFVAHSGGLLAGFAVALLLRHRRDEPALRSNSLKAG